MSAVKTKGAQHFEAQLDAALPNRKRPDGWIGDAAHRAHSSSHNPDDTPGSKPEWDGDGDKTQEVRALDVAAPLTAAVSGQRLVDHLRALPNVSTVIRYLIHNGRMYHERDGFKPTAYAGDPHTGHVHITFAFTQAADNNTTYDYRFGNLEVVDHGTKGWLAMLTDAQQAQLFYRVTRVWFMVRNLESLAYAGVRGQESRPQWKDTETGYTYPAVAIAPNVSLAKLLGADRLTEQELHDALAAAVPSADANAAALLDALGAESVDDIAAALRALLGPERAAQLGADLAAPPAG